jgi:zinc protease
MPRFIIILCALLLAAAAFAAAPKTAAKRAQAGGKLSFPRLESLHRTLGNGLEVYSVPDRSSPTVAIQVWYHVGSKDDPQGRSGFAHLFEHIMFKSTKHMPAEEMDRLTEDVGGANNASTADDFTDYYDIRRNRR